MEHKKISYALIAAGALAALGGLFLFFVYAPLIGQEFQPTVPEAAGLYIPMLGTVWCTGAVYAAAMFFYFRIVWRIGRDESFSASNARDMGRIALCMLIAGLLLVVLGLLPCILQGIGAGSFWIMTVLAATASICVGTLAWGIGRLLQRAVSLKEENDLTI